MNHDVSVPEVGESITSGILTAWLKDDGATVSEGEELFELETDKATLSVPSPFSGTLRISAAADTEVSVGQIVATINSETSGSGTPGEGLAAPAGGGAAPETDPSRVLSPAVRRVVEEHRLDADTIQGTGKAGRLTKGDVLRAIGDVPQPNRDVLQAAEAAGKKAEEGPARAEPVSIQTSVPGSEQRESSVQPAERRSRKKMTTIRKRIAERLVQAKLAAAHLTTFNEIDMEQVMMMRKKYRETFEKKHGIRLGFMSFFIKACCRALETFPSVNAMIDGDEIVYNHYTDIGVAVSTDRGLIVPVIREADKKSFAEIEKEISSFATRAREKKLTIDELTGGTFSITNGGVFGSLLSTPLPNPPQTAILGMHAIQRRPVAVEESIVIRPMMYVALTYDHRLIDGKEAVSFLVKVKQLVEDPDQMLLDL
jgi:2-oxoglutarate dehydrogenase E2 component (dihydrolipoamide succinyltransferase)